MSFMDLEWYCQMALQKDCFNLCSISVQHRMPVSRNLASLVFFVCVFCFFLINFLYFFKFSLYAVELSDCPSVGIIVSRVEVLIQRLANRNPQ